MLVAGLVAYLHERAEAQEETLRRFAGQAIDIAAAMAGEPERKGRTRRAEQRILSFSIRPRPILTRRPRSSAG